MEENKNTVQKNSEPIKKITLKQRKFIKFYLTPGPTYGNISASALKAGYKHREAGLKMISNGIIQGLFQELLEREGITDAKIAQCILEGLNATKLQVCDIYVQEEDESGKMKVTLNKNSNDFIEVPDHHARDKFLGRAIKLLQKEPAPLKPADEDKKNGESVLFELIKQANGDGNGQTKIRIERSTGKLSKFVARKSGPILQRTPRD